MDLEGLMRIAHEPASPARSLSPSEMCGHWGTQAANLAWGRSRRQFIEIAGPG